MTKYQTISALAEYTARNVAQSEENWKHYLTTAARLYKYPFNEQMLIYAQRQDATACASLETWNEKMNCWVNRGAKGIALIDTDSERPRLKYVFDVSDVHKARRIGRDPYLWELKEEHKAPVLAQLEKTYGATDVNMPFEERIMEIADRIAQDYYEELLPELNYVKEGSFLDDLDELNLGIRLRETLASSIFFTLLSRCGADMDLWKDDMNFEYIHEFNNTKSLAVIGNATTEMCKPLLMEIGRTIRAYERQIARQNASNKAREKAAGEHIGSHEENVEKGLANAPEADHNALKRESETTVEKPKATGNHTEMEGIANETDIRKERGLSDSEPDSERGAGAGTDQVRTDEEELSEGTQERDLSGNGTDRGAESTLSAGTGAGRTENGTSDRTDGEVGGSERGAESSQSDELGSEDEQHQTLSGENRVDRTDLHLSSEEQSNITMQEPDSDSNSLSGSFSDKTEDFTELQKGILCFDNHLIHKRPEIAGYFQSEQDAVLQTEYLKNSFRMEEFTELYIGDVRAGYRADEDGLTMWKGNYLTREAESRLSWEDARYWVNSYIEDDVYLLPGEVAEQIDTDGMFKQLDLFTMFTEQVGNIAMKQAEEKSVMPTGFVLPEKQIDDILRSGGGRDDSRKRIYAKYRQRKTPEEMTAFLKKEYGTTGKGFEFDGKQIAVWFDEGGMSVGYGTSATEQLILTMEWKEIDQNIRRQVENGTYMGANEAYLVDEVERSRIANHLFFFFRDGMGEMPEELELKVGNYPDAHARLVELLSAPEEVERIAAHMDHALHQLETGEKSLRFRSVMPKELRAELDNLLVDKLTFPAAEHVEIKHDDFITQDEIDHRLGRGSGFSHGSFRIYDYFKEGHDSKEAANFLKNEYGTGGSTHALAGADHSYEDHDAKEIKLKKGNIGKPYAEVLLSWKVVEKRIRKLIEGDRYLSPEGKESYAQYRVEQEQKALEQAQAKMEHETKVACKNAIEKAIAEKFDGYRLPKDTAEAVIQEYGSERVSYVLANSVMHKREDGRFSAENKEWAKAIEPYAMVKNEDMVVDSHPAVLNGFINQTRRYIEQEKELAAQAVEKVTIDGQECIEVDEWGTEEETYVLGNSVTDKQFFYAEVNGVSFEYDYQPQRGEVEEDYLNEMAERDIDRHEAEVFARIEGSDNAQDGVEEAPLVAEDVQNLVLINREYSAGTRTTVYDFECDIRGEHDTLQYTLEQHDDGEGFTIHTQKDDIWERMSEPELERLEGIISREALYFKYHDKIAGAKSVEDMEEIQFSIMEDESPYFSAVSDRVWKEFNQKENELSGENRETSGQDVQKPEEVSDTPLEPDIEVPVKQAEPQIGKTGAVKFRITDDALGIGTAKEKFRRNVEAIRTLEKIESENRIATPEEQEILSQYVGWGGLADAFDESKSTWANEYQELKGLLSEQEYSSARESTLNAHYTSPAIIRSIYDALDKMGFEKGNVLEPAMGIGNFFGMLPEKMQESRLYGVELDGITGRIAKQLYPNADIKIAGFEKTDYPNDFFDVAIGNVPFGQYKVADKQYDKQNFLIHDYFFAKTLDKVRPGGVVAFVTSKGTMDKKSPEVRKYLAQRAELLGAVRLPNTAFKENAGTEVTSDILFLKKRDRVMDLEPDWVHLSEDENGIAMNSYFAEHPEMIVGKMEMVSGPYGMESTCMPDTTRPFAQQLQEAVSHIDGEIEAVELDELADELADATIPADPDVKNYSYTLVDDRVYYRENSIMKPVDMSDSMQERIKGMVGIRNCTQELINLQLEEYPDTVIKEKQAELNSLYDAFSKKHGLINSQTNKRAFNQDSSYCLLCSLEKLDDEGNFKGKADMFTKRTIKKAEVVTSVDTASEALAVSLSEKAREVGPDTYVEEIPSDCLIVDKIHAAIVRLFEKQNGIEPIAPSIRIINLSLGDPVRQLATLMSPLARLIDYMAYKYSVLFIVSAGNHPETIDMLECTFDELKGKEIYERSKEYFKCISANQRNIKVLSPAENINGLTIGALYDDYCDIDENNRAIFAVQKGLPSPISSYGKGYRSIITPDLFYRGGRKFISGTWNGQCKWLQSNREPGCRVAAPTSDATKNGQAFSFGTSDATALISHEALKCYDVLYNIYQTETGEAPPKEYVAILLKAMLTHGASWGELASRVAEITGAKEKQISRWLGYGIPNVSRVEECAKNRVTLIGTGSLKKDEGHIFSLPLPVDISSKVIKRRLVVTLAYFSPVEVNKQAYRSVKLWFDVVGNEQLASNRENTEWQAVQKGTLQHEIFEGEKALIWNDDKEIQIKVNCKEDAGKIKKAIPYCIFVTFEVAEGQNIDVYSKVVNKVKTAIKP